MGRVTVPLTEDVSGSNITLMTRFAYLEYIICSQIECRVEILHRRERHVRLGMPGVWANVGGIRDTCGWLERAHSSEVVFALLALDRRLDNVFGHLEVCAGTKG
jgi:hypothetical protein